MTEQAFVWFALPDFNHKKEVEYPFYLDSNTCQKEGSYDMIMGHDILQTLGRDIKLSSRSIKWGGMTILMRPTGSFWSKKQLYELVQSAQESTPIKEAEAQQEQILNAHDEATDLKTVVNNCIHLTTRQWTALLHLLQQYHFLFDGMLGTFNMQPVTLELKANSTPYHAKPFSILKIYEEILWKECD